jgi:hypothetical protein
MWYKIKLLFKKFKTVEELHENTRTVRDVAFWIDKNIHYLSDQEKWKQKNYWQTSKQTLKFKSGDCEDFSILFYDVIKLKGYIPHILSVWSDRGGAHAVCAFKAGDVWWHYSNWGLKKTRHQLFEDVAENVYKDWYMYIEKTTSGKKIGNFKLRRT